MEGLEWAQYWANILDEGVAYLHSVHYHCCVTAILGNSADPEHICCIQQTHSGFDFVVETLRAQCQVLVSLDVDEDLVSGRYAIEAGETWKTGFPPHREALQSPTAEQVHKRPPSFLKN